MLYFTVPEMTSELVREAVTLSLMGVGTAIVVLALLMIVTMGLRLLNGGISPRDLAATGKSNDKKLAAVIAVSLLLREAGESASTSQEQSSHTPSEQRAAKR